MLYCPPLSPTFYHRTHYAHEEAGKTLMYMLYVEEKEEEYFSISKAV